MDEIAAPGKYINADFPKPYSPSTQRAEETAIPIAAPLHKSRQGVRKQPKAVKPERNITVRKISK